MHITPPVVRRDVVVAWTLQSPTERVKLRLVQRASRELATDVGAIRVGRLCPRCGSEQHGRPYIVGRRDLALSLSGASGVTAVAVARGPSVGVDVEHLDDERFAEVGDVLLHPAEHASGGSQLARTWVRKESVLKMMGVGLEVDPRAVRVSGPGEPPELLEPRPTGDATRVWLEDLAVVPLLLGCVAVQAARRPTVTTLEVAPEDPAA